MKAKTLTKSRFKLAMECETKLFYTGKKEYGNSKMDDSFLKALADGGFQVGEIAKNYYPGGHDIKPLDYEEALAQTNELLKQENVVIYEPAIRFEDLFIRVDILIKKGSHFELIEVKAKSFDPKEENPFLKKNGQVNAEWFPYLSDVCFQAYVFKNAFPDSVVSSYLMMADKSAMCPTEGLNQKFQIFRDNNNRTGVRVTNQFTPSDLKKPILIKVPVDLEIQAIEERWSEDYGTGERFSETLKRLSQSYKNDEKIVLPIGSQCAKCEFQTEPGSDQKSGFKECWQKQLGWTDKDFNDPLVLGIWNYKKKQALIEQGIYKMSDVHEEDISPKENKGAGMSLSERQWLQVEMVKDNLNEPKLLSNELNDEIQSWVYPLHFIDFETSTMAIPFNKGRRPYEVVAFQFSHHTVNQSGVVAHAGQYLNTVRDHFPNYDFLRELKKQLEGDKGTVFRYATHENTVLNQIYEQLQSDPNPPADKEDLCEFIKTISQSKATSTEKWCGPRNMVDMCELVKKFYYDPDTKGSNSIKHVLPSILNRSAYLQKKYSEAIYGAGDGIKSLNFKNWQWIHNEAGKIKDPYKCLPKLFDDVSDHNFDLISQEDELRNGGAAMIAYARMQFSEMSGYEHEQLEKALLKYCELDTLAMVMLFEGWQDLIKKIKSEAA
jgi:hypothetical protein